MVEVWNLVFIEFNRKADGSLEKLPEQHIDTGMGFERLCMVLQNKTSNYDTDVFTPLIREIEALTKTEYGHDLATDRAIRVIADHVRAVYFAIADGQLPSNNGAGYVIEEFFVEPSAMGLLSWTRKNPLFTFGQHPRTTDGVGFPELSREQKLAFNVIREEETSFLKTLDQGLILLDTILANTANKTLDGAKAFELYDTYGFPFDLTALIASERGFSVDEKGFAQAMEQQKKQISGGGSF